MGKTTLALIVLTLSAGILFLLGNLESVFVLNPLIDTRLPPGFTQAGFDRIQPGMTKAEVLQLVPLPEPDSLYMVSWGYGSDGACVFWDFAWFQLTIEFDQNGRVIKKTQRAFYD